MVRLCFSWFFLRGRFIVNLIVFLIVFCFIGEFLIERI